MKTLEQPKCTTESEPLAISILVGKSSFPCYYSFSLQKKMSSKVVVKKPFGVFYGSYVSSITDLLLCLPNQYWYHQGCTIGGDTIVLVSLGAEILVALRFSSH